MLKERKIFDKEKPNLNKFIDTLFSNLDVKENKILRQRFGLENKKKKTLESIGENYNLSKERIRQIQNQALNKLKQAEDLESLIEQVRNQVTELFNQKGGIITEKFIFSQSEEPQAFIFIISQFLYQDLEKMSNHPKLEASWRLKSLSLNLIEEFLETTLNIIRERKASFKEEELLDLIKETHVYKKYDLDDSNIFSYIEASKEIKKNVLGDYGLIYWREIIPKRIADKIYIVFQKEKTPLHFKEITEKINELGFDHKIANSRAVHNELILDKRFVFTDRGVYTLKQWSQ